MPLIGNKQRLAFELAPVAPAWETRYPVERAAWAGLAIWVGDHNLCAHLLDGAGAVEEFFYVPLGPIGDWLYRALAALEFEERAPGFPTTSDIFASAERWADTQPGRGFTDDQWFDAREAWWTRHFLAAGAEGAWLPNLGIVRADEQMTIMWSEPRISSGGRPTMLSPRGSFSLSWAEGYDVLREFVRTVAEWFREAGLADVYAWITPVGHDRWPQATLELALELYTARSIESLSAILGTPDYAALLSALDLHPDARDPASSAKCQAIRDLSPAPSPGVGDLLQETYNRASQAQTSRSRFAELRALAIDGARAGSNEIEAGQLAATAVRRALALDGQPISETPALLSDCGIVCMDPAVDGELDRMVVVGTSERGVATATLQTPRTIRPWGRRFEHVRALGHALLDPWREGALGAASGPFAQDTRRRRSGAFAAELLLPAVAMSEVSAGSLDGIAEGSRFEDLLVRFGVGAQTGAWQLWNRGWVSSPEVRDGLIDAYAQHEDG